MLLPGLRSAADGFVGSAKSCALAKWEFRSVIAPRTPHATAGSAQSTPTEGTPNITCTHCRFNFPRIQALGSKPRPSWCLAFSTLVVTVRLSALHPMAGVSYVDGVMAACRIRNLVLGISRLHPRRAAAWQYQRLMCDSHLLWYCFSQ